MVSPRIYANSAFGAPRVLTPMLSFVSRDGAVAARCPHTAEVESSILSPATNPPPEASPPPRLISAPPFSEAAGRGPHPASSAKHLFLPPLRPPPQSLDTSCSFMLQLVACSSAVN